MDVVGCDSLNNIDPKDQEESSSMKYHLAPSPQFENVENFGNVVSNDWIPWVNNNTENSSGEFVVDHVFTSKSTMQDAIKFYSIKAY